MAGLCEGGNESPGSLKATKFVDDMALLAEEEMKLKDMLLELNDSCEQYGMKINAINCPKTGQDPTSDTIKASLMGQLGQEIMGKGGQFLSPSIAYIAD
ncbi:hypothetical protein ANN_10097 [Periplaneta americana]|uniref:Reverse transcriptase domain-containing protein n=1 Tax=Periplaneta americana TaxID=6978 RepID=A0ABQ8TQS9_PERAM|nr:hypothetical protein ANN_10097 [Periplaneta americana]